MTVRFTSLIATPSTTGTLKVGDSVTFTAVVNQPVEVTGLPLLILNVENPAIYDAVLSKPAEGRLIFHYVVKPGDVTDQLTVLALSPVGSSISSPGSMIFNNPVNYGAGDHPAAAATADVNGDGILDLVTASYADGTVSVRLGQKNLLGASGAFGSATTYKVGGHPTGIAIGDFTGKGRPDIAVSDAAGNVVTILPAEADAKGPTGNFSDPKSYATAVSPLGLTAVKLTPTGPLGLAVVTGNKTVSVLVPNRSGGFLAPQNYAVGSSPAAIAAADVNGDGESDILVANRNSNTVSVLIDDGQGGFGNGITYNVGDAPNALLVADVNGDGVLDLITGSARDSTVSVLLGTGNGRFGPKQDFIVDGTPTSIAAGDFNGDGKVDLAVSEQAGGVSFLVGLGDGTFKLPFAAAAGNSSVAVVSGDFNKDGLADVAVINAGSDNVSVLVNNSVTPGNIIGASILTAQLSVTPSVIKVEAAQPSVIDQTVTPGSGSYGVGASLSINVTFSAAVAVDGTPTLTLSDGGTARYVSGGGTATLVFATTVAAGQNADGLVVTGITLDPVSQALPSGGRIRDVNGNDADLTRITTRFADVTVDTTPPTVSAATTTAAAGTFGTGQVIDVTLTGSEALFVSGTPTLSTSSTSGGVATYVSGSGTTKLVFAYTVATGDRIADFSVKAVSLAGAAITDAAGNNAILNKVAATFKGVALDARIPAVLSVGAGSGLKNLDVGDAFTLDVKFGVAVKVTGIPVLTLNDGGTATYVSGSGTTDLVFTGTVAAGQNAKPLAVTGVSLPDDRTSIKDATAGVAANLAGAVRSLPSIVVDTSAPTVTALVASPANGTLAAGGIITVQEVFSKIVTVSGGRPTLTLSDGGVAQYLSGSGTNRLVFTSTVVAGQVTPDLTVTKLDLNGAVIADARGRAADLTGAVGNPAGTLAIAAQPVTVTSILALPSATGPLGVGSTVTFNAAVDRPVAVTGTPVLTLNDGGTASYDAAASTATNLVFRTTIAAGQNAANLAVTGMTLDGAAVTVPDAPLTFSSPTAYDGNGPAGLYLSGLALADVNNDGILDLITPTASSSPHYLTVSLGDGGGGFAPAYKVSTETDDDTNYNRTDLLIPSVTTGDVNNDGNVDLVLKSASNESVAVLLGDGRGGFSAPISSTKVGGDYRIDPVLVDVNGDGELDIVVGDIPIYSANGVSGGIRTALGDGTGHFGSLTDYTITTVQYNSITSIVAADVTGDGKVDIVATTEEDHVYVLPGDGQGGFGAQKTYNAGQTVRRLVVGDVNGDGRPDLVTTSYNSTKVSVLLADGTGGFGAPVLYASGTTRPENLALADVNGDGKSDVLVADYDGGVEVMLGDGLGGFGAPTKFAAGPNPDTLFVRDVDSDGRPDIVVIGSPYAYDGFIRVALNTTTGPSVFSPAGAATALGGTTGLVVDTLAPTIMARGVSVGRGVYDVGQTIDITLTGTEPMLVTGSPTLALNDGGTATYVGGSGTATLLFRTTVAAGQNAATLGVTGVTLPAGAAIRDAAGNDANLGGAAASFGGVSVVTTAPVVRSVTAAPASGTFGVGATLTFSVVLDKAVGVARGVPTLALNDGGVARYVSGSGTDTLVFSTTVSAGQSAADLAVMGINLNGATVADRAGRAANLSGAIGNPAGTLAVSATAATPSTVTAITAKPSAAGPLDAGNTVAFTVALDTPVAVTGAPVLTLNNGAAASFDAGASTTTSLVFRYTVSAGQIAPNLTVTGLTLNGATVAVPGGLSFAKSEGAPLGATVPGSILADVNGDGRLDTVVADQAGRVLVGLGDGAGAFSAPEPYATSNGTLAVAAADVNGDGRLDLVTGNQDLTTSAGSYSVLLGAGDGTFGPAATTLINGGLADPQAVAVTDVNGDGRPDLLVATAGHVDLLLGNGAGGFTPSAQFQTGFSPNGIAVADLNGDGRLDLAVSYLGTPADTVGGVPIPAQPGGISVLLANGTGGFVATTSYTAGYGTDGLTVADLNGDGAPGLIAADSLSGTVSVMLGNGIGGFGGTTSFAAGVAPSGVAAADLDGDGRLDLVVSDGYRQFDFLLGTGTAGSAAPPPTPAATTGLEYVAAADLDGDGRPDLVTTSVTGVPFTLRNTSVVGSPVTIGGVAGAAGSETGLTVDAIRPMVTGTAPLPGGNDAGTYRPFAAARVSDAHPYPADTLTITTISGGVPTDAVGTLSGAGLTQTGTGTYTLPTGTPAAVTAALRALVFTPASNRFLPGTVSAVQFGLSLSDGVHTVTDTATTLAITSLGSTPTIGGTAPNQAENATPTAVAGTTAYAATEQTALVLKGTGLSVGDVDGRGGTETATLTVGEGTLSATAGDSGATLSGSGTATLTVRGTTAQIDALLGAGGTSTLSYTDGTDTPAAATQLTLSIDDGGNTGSGGAKTAQATATIAVQAVNDAPVAMAATQTYQATEKTRLSLKNTGLSVSDVDGGAGILTATLSVGEGMLEATAGDSGATVTGSGTGTLSINGTMAQIDALLGAGGTSTLSYVDANNNPSVSTGLTLTIDDGGNSGVGGALSSRAGATIRVAPEPDVAVLASTIVYDGGGTFTLTGFASSAAGVASVEISAVIDGGDRVTLGAATLNGDGSFSFVDHVGAHLQGFVTATETDTLGQQATAAFHPALQGGLAGSTFAGRPYVARLDAYSASGADVTSTAETYFHRNGSRTVDVLASGQTFHAHDRDTFLNHGAGGNTFVFDPGYGHDVVHQFRVNGADHDTVSLLGSDFGNDIATVLRNAHNVRGGVEIVDPTSQDTIRLTGVSKAQLVHNKEDFVFHS